jgi:hypothetical protein
MGVIKAKAQSTQGTRSRLARAQPRAKAADSGGFTSRPRAPSNDEHTFGSPEAQSSRRSNLSQIDTPTDRITGASLHDGSLTATYGWLLKRPSATYGWSLKTFSDP